MNTYPQSPMTLSADSTMSEDYIATDDILVNATMPCQIAPFSVGGTTQALVVVEGNLYLLRRDPTTESGWSMAGVANSAVQAPSVVSGVDAQGVIWGFFPIMSEGELVVQGMRQETGGYWNWPLLTDSVVQPGSALRVTYDTDNNLLVYGVTPTGTVFVFDPQAGATSTIDVGVNLCGTAPSLCVTAHDWALAAVVPGQGLISWYGPRDDGGFLTGDYAAQTMAASNTARIIASYLIPNGGFSFLYISDDTMNALAVDWAFGKGTGGTSVVANVAVTGGSGLVDTGGMMHLYCTDVDGTLWVLHQVGWTGNAFPAWAPIIALDTDVVAVATDTVATDAIDLFVIDDAIGALRYHSQDPVTFNWNTSVVLLPSTNVYQVSRYRTEVALVDANGVPVPGYAVSVAADSACDVWVAGTTYSIDAAHPAALMTDVFGKITLSTLATSASTPQLTFSYAEGGAPSSLAVSPDATLQAYLAGGVGLNNLPAFNGATLAAASLPARAARPGQALAAGLSGGPLTADEAASYISGLVAAGYAIPSGGITVTLSPTAAGTVAALARGPAGGIFDDFDRLAKDALHGLEKAASKVESIAVDLTNSACTFVSAAFSDVVIFTVSSMDDVVSVVHGIFQSIGATAQDVLDWLKALFDWTNIWNTKTALQQALTQIGASLGTELSVLNDHLPTAFSGLESYVENNFGTLIAELTGQSITDIVPPAPVGAILGGETAASGGVQVLAGQNLFTGSAASVAPVDFAGRVHHNWFLDKLLAFFGEGPSASPTPSSADLEMYFSNPPSGLNSAITDLADAAKNVWNALTTTAEVLHGGEIAPAQFAQVEIADLLSAANDLVHAVLAVADAGCTFLIDVAQAVVQVMDTLWTLEIPALSTLVNFVYSLAYPGNPALDVGIADVFCLLAAVPLTLVYELANGPGASLFPGGTLPAAGDPAGPAAAPTVGLGSSVAIDAIKFTAVGLQVAWSFYDTGLDALGNPENLVLNIIDLVFLVLGQIFTWPSGIPFTTLNIDTPGEKAVFANWMVGWSFFFVDYFFLFGNKDAVGWQESIARASDIGAVIDSALGAGNLISGVVEIVLNHESGGTVAANVLGPLSYAFQFLTTDALKAASEDMSVAGKMAIDLLTGLATAAGMAYS